MDTNNDIVELSTEELEILSAEGAETLKCKLKNSLSQLLGRSKAIQSRADAEHRDLSTDEDAQLQKIFGQFNAAEAKLKGLGDEGGPRILNLPARARQVGPARVANALAPGQQRLNTPALTIPKSARFADLFGQAQPQAHDTSWSSFGNFALTCLNNPRDHRLMNTMSEGSGEAGGFLVPIQYTQALLDRSLEVEIIRPRATVIPATSGTLVAPSFNYQDTSGNARAGLVLRWVGELQTNTPQTPKVTELNFRPHKGAIFVDASTELSQDVPSFSLRLEQAMTAAVAAGLDYAFLWGSVGMPRGIIPSAATIVVSKEGSQTADTIVEQNVVKMAGRLQTSSWRNSVWIVSPSALVQLLTLSQVAGPNAGGRIAQLHDDGSLTLLTRPVLVSDQAAPLGDKGDIIFADLSRYVIAMRREAYLETSTGPGWYEHRLGFRLTVRVDGIPDAPTAQTMRDGINTMSPFITLEERG